MSLRESQDLSVCVSMLLTNTLLTTCPRVLLDQTRSMNDLRGVGHDSPCSIIECDRPVLASVNVKALVSLAALVRQGCSCTCVVMMVNGHCTYSAEGKPSSHYCNISHSGN